MLKGFALLLKYAFRPQWVLLWRGSFQSLLMARNILLSKRDNHIKEKSIGKIAENMKRLIHDIEFPSPGKRAEHAAVARFNAYVFGVHKLQHGNYGMS